LGAAIADYYGEDEYRHGKVEKKVDVPIPARSLGQHDRVRRQGEEREVYGADDAVIAAREEVKGHEGNEKAGNGAGQISVASRNETHDANAEEGEGQYDQHVRQIPALDADADRLRLIRGQNLVK